MRNASVLIPQKRFARSARGPNLDLSGNFSVRIVDGSRRPKFDPNEFPPPAETDTTGLSLRAPAIVAEREEIDARILMLADQQAQHLGITGTPVSLDNPYR